MHRENVAYYFILVVKSRVFGILRVLSFKDVHDYLEYSISNKSLERKPSFMLLFVLIKSHDVHHRSAICRVNHVFVNVKCLCNPSNVKLFRHSKKAYSNSCFIWFQEN